MTVTHEHVATNGIRLHVAQAGPIDGPLVLLLHGFPEFWAAWQRQISWLAERGYCVWAPDQRGYNLSDKPASVRDYRLDALAGDVLGLIAAAGRESAIFIGHDWGGIVTWRLAARHPERVSRAVVLNAPHPTAFRNRLLRSPRQLLRSSYVAWFQLPRLPERLALADGGRRFKQVLRRTSRPGTFSEADLERYRQAWEQPGAMTAMLNWYRAAARLPSQTNVGRVAVPLLLLWGDGDAFLDRRLAEASLAMCDAARLVHLPEATHWLHHEQPERVNTQIGEFLSEET